MSRTGPNSLVGKGLPTVVYIFVIAMVIFYTNHVYAACPNSEGCNNATAGNSTFVFDQFSNSTVLIDAYSNATSYQIPSNLTFNQYSNSTMSFDGFSNSTLPSDQFENSTWLGEHDTNQTLSSVMNSFNLTSDGENSTTSDKQGANSLHLEGDSYVDANASVPNVASLTVTAWIKPDYSQGSPVFTVVSDTNEFVLAVNNDIPATKHAVFSVFDGIKWTTVQSTDMIPENWTYLVATYNGTSIGIYVNGILENTIEITGIPVLVDGELVTRTDQNLTSDANVTIGAYYDKTRHNAQDLFSGEISDVKLYDIALSQAQIEKMFHHTKPIDNATSYN